MTKITKDHVENIVYEKIVDAIFKHTPEERIDILKKIMEYRLKTRLGHGRTRTAGSLGCKIDRRNRKIQKDTFVLTVSLNAVSHNLGKKFNGHVIEDMKDAVESVVEHEVVHFMHAVITDGPSNHGPQFKRLALKYFGHTEARIKQIKGGKGG